MAHMMILLVKNDIEKLNQGKGLFKVTSIHISGSYTTSSLLVNKQFDLHESCKMLCWGFDSRTSTPLNSAGLGPGMKFFMGRVSFMIKLKRPKLRKDSKRSNG